MAQLLLRDFNAGQAASWERDVEPVWPAHTPLLTFVGKLKYLDEILFEAFTILLPPELPTGRGLSLILFLTPGSSLSLLLCDGHAVKKIFSPTTTEISLHAYGRLAIR